MRWKELFCAAAVLSDLYSRILELYYAARKKKQYPGTFNFENERSVKSLFQQCKVAKNSTFSGVSFE